MRREGLLLAALVLFPLWCGACGWLLAPLFHNPPAIPAVLSFVEGQLFGLGWLVVRRERGATGGDGG